MKPNRILGLVSLAFPWLVSCVVFGSGAFAQDAVTLPRVALNTEDGIAADSMPMTRDRLESYVLDDQPNPPEKPYPWRIAVYPALAWAPIFGTSVDLPPTPSNPIAPSGSTDTSFNGAYFGGARVERSRWSGDILFMWAALSANRTTPTTNVGLDFVFGDAMVGYELPLPGLYVEGGFRRLALNLNATVQSESVAVSPGYWDPLLGLTYRRQLGKKWRVLAHVDGGGFGVGSDVDITATGRAEWQFARHYGITMGYGLMHLSNGTSNEYGAIHLRPTLHGPILGFGLYF